MAEKPERHASGDDLGQFLAFALAVVGCAFLATLYTGPALIGSAVVLLISWFLGLQEREFPLLLLLSVSVIVIAFAFASGSGEAIAAHWLHSYYVGARSGLQGLYRAWLETFFSGNGSALAIPIGICAASAAVLVRDSHRKSLSARLMQAGYPVPSRPAPIVLLRRWWVQRHPHLAGSITLGVDLKTGARVALGIEDLTRMMLVVGSTGAGKTNTLKLLLETWLQHGLPAVYVCGKGDSMLARAVHAFARRLGRTAYLFDASQPAQSCTYNPVAHGDATSCADRITTIMDHSDQHWEKLDRGFLQLVFLVLAAAGIRIDLLQLARYLDTKSLLAALRRKGTQDRDREQALANDIVQQKGVEKNIAGLRAEIRNLSQSSLAGLFDSRSDKRCINLEQARDESAYVHFVLPSLSYPKWAKQLGRLIVNDIKSVVSTSNKPWLIILDEFHAYAGENVMPLVSMGRGFGVAVALSTQALSDLQRISSSGPNPAFADSLLGSLNLYLIHSLNSPADAEMAAALIGTASELELTAQTEADRPNEMGSLRAVRSYRQHPDALKTARLGEATFVNKVRGFVAQVGVRLSSIAESDEDQERDESRRADS